MMYAYIVVPSCSVYRTFQSRVRLPLFPSVCSLYDSCRVVVTAYDESISSRVFDTITQANQNVLIPSVTASVTLC